MEAKMLMRDLFDLAGLDDDSYCEVYCSSTLLSLQSMFPAKILTDLNEFRGSAKERMERMYEYLDHLFEEANEILSDLDKDNPGANHLAHEFQDDDLGDIGDDSEKG